MKTFLNTLSLILFSFLIMACGTSSNNNLFTNTQKLGIDSTNDRLFVTASEGTIYALTASTTTHISDQAPFVDEDTNAATHALLPEITLHFATLANGTNSRLFFNGFLNNASSGSSVFNDILVLDFDGSNFSEASFSPITISDNNVATDETDNTFSDMIVDSTNNQIIIADQSGGFVHFYSTTDGTQVRNPIAIAGTIQNLAISDNRLFVSNSSTASANQVVTTISLADFSTTSIPVSNPLSLITVKNNATGTVMVTKNANDQEVYIQLLNSTFTTATNITSNTTDINDGILSAGRGISSSVQSLQLTKNSDDLLYLYVSEQDGNIQFVEFNSALTQFELSTSATVVLKIGNADILIQDSVESLIYFVGQSGSLISTSVGTTDFEIDT